MSDEDPGRQTRIIDVKGRAIVVRQLRDAQYGLLVREANSVKRAVAEGNRDRLMRATDLIMKALASTVVQEEDRDWLDDMTANGELDFSDLVAAIRAFGDEEEKPKAQVRRGRPVKRT